MKNLLKHFVLLIALFGATSVGVLAQSNTSTNFRVGDKITILTGGTTNWGTSTNWLEVTAVSPLATTSTTAPSGTTVRAHIRKPMVTNGNQSSGSVFVKNGASLTVDPNTNTLTVSDTFWIETGGSVQQDGLVVMGPSNVTGKEYFRIDSAGTYTLSNNATRNTSSLWAGTEAFMPFSNFILEDFDFTATAPANRLVATTPQISANSAGYLFGNLTINSPSTTTFQIVSGAPTGVLKLVGNKFDLEAYGGTITLTNSTSTIEFGGDFEVSIGATTTNLSRVSGTTPTNVRIKGDLILNDVLDLNSTSGSTTAAFNLYLFGDLLVNAGANLNSTNFSSTLHFDSTVTQLVFTSPTSTITELDMIVRTGALVRISTSNLRIGNASTITVANGGRFEFGAGGIDSFNVVESASASSTSFTVADGGTIVITSREGIDKDPSDLRGNVQLDSRVFSQDGIYIFKGIGNATTGDFFNLANFTDSTTDAGIVVNVTDSLTLTSGGSLGINGNGYLNIISGTFIENDMNYIQNGSASSGALTMSGGTLLSRRTTGTIPDLSGTYNLTGGTVELGAFANQTLRGGKSYFNLLFNRSGIKTLSSSIVLPSNSVTNNVTITDFAVLDLASNSLEGAAGLTMDDSSRFRSSKLNSLLPALTGTYNLTGGTVEFYGTTSTQKQAIRALDGQNAQITYFNVEAKSVSQNSTYNEANLSLDNGFVNITNRFEAFGRTGIKINSGSGIEGLGRFILGSSGLLKVGDTAGIVLASTTRGALRNTGTRTLPTTASYGFVGSQNMSTGSGFPANVANIFIEKLGLTNAVGSPIATLTQNLRIDSGLFLRNGRIQSLATRKLTLGTANTVVSGKGDSVNTLDADDRDSTSFVQGPLRINTNANITPRGLPLGQDTSARPVVITPASSSAATYEAEYFNVNPTSAGFDTALKVSSLKRVSGVEYWNVSQVSGSIPAFVTLGWGRTSGVHRVTKDSIRVAHWNGTRWTNEGGTNINGTSRRGGVSSKLQTVFSPFTLGSTSFDNPLPVELTRFVGYARGNDAVLDWNTASEENNEGFSVQRSLDGSNFNEIDWKYGFGTTQTPRNYSATDRNAANLAGLVYYRLQQRDFNGARELSNIVAVRFSAPALDATPGNLTVIGSGNDVRITLQSDATGNLNIDVINTSGQVVASSTQAITAGYNQLNVPVSTLSQGVYTVRATSATSTYMGRLVR